MDQVIVMPVWFYWTLVPLSVIGLLMVVSWLLVGFELVMNILIPDWHDRPWGRW